MSEELPENFRVCVMFDEEIEVASGELCGPHAQDGAEFCALRQSEESPVVIVAMPLCPGLIHGIADRLREQGYLADVPEFSEALDDLCAASERLIEVFKGSE